MFSSNKENINVNIPSRTIDIKSQGYEVDVKNLEEAIKNICISCSAGGTLSSGLRNLGIPLQSLQGIESFNEGMQIFFRDAFNLARIFSLIMAIKLNIFNIIQSNVSNQNQFNQFTSIHDIKSKIADSNITERHLLDLLCELESQGLLVSEGTLENIKFKNTDLAMNYFTNKSANNLSRMYMNIKRFILSFYENLENNFKFGKPINHSEYNFNNEDEVRMVLDYFYLINETSFERMLETIDFSRFKTCVDLRGGYGVLAMKIKSRFPNVNIISYDNPSLEKYADDKVNSMNMKNVVSIVSGNLLSDKLPESDCFIAPHLLVHFNNENLLKVLKNISDSITSHGQLIILENLIDTDKKESRSGSISFMMGLQNCEGNTRSFSEFTSMLNKSGFKSVEKIPMNIGMCDIIIASK